MDQMVSQVQGMAQEAIKAIQAFSSLVRQMLPIIEEHAKTKAPQDRGLEFLIANAKTALGKWD